MKRYSVLYLLKGQYQHVLCSTLQEAELVVSELHKQEKRQAVGIYDGQSRRMTLDSAYATELSHKQLVTIVEAVRRRDASWYPTDSNYRMSYFA